ncbi:GTP-binding protein [Micromonospora olivasterospora]|uniref:Dynamin family protein n=1 Tax=Micromonospora olivasterospora TaxID=1880 RepID=A0A562IIG2_MICOL|nr:hypothetical protein [Micromonospora olivasterospora]TWH70404.1 hypothetical protein JD77_05429 [Micromonospora olivasterospora]
MSGGKRLDEAVYELLRDALDRFRDDPRAVGHLRHQLDRLEAPLHVAIAGPWQSGKSTALNAIMGEEVAPVEVPEGRCVLTWYEDAPHPRATAYSSAGPPQVLAVTKSPTGMRVDLVGLRPGEVDDIVVRWPTRALRQATLIDTPAVAPPGEDGRAPVLDRILRDADAVLYLTRDGRDSDLQILQATRTGVVDQAAPANVILVLSRADEFNGGRVDALLTARQLARRLRRDPRVDALCVNVVALSGLVGLAGRLMGESDFAALAALAGTPRGELEQSLLSAERFLTTTTPPARLDAGVRAALLDRFGLFGVRLATTLIRTGCDSRVRLSAELIRRSGFTELRESMNRCFVDRCDVLKARSALAALEALLRAEPRPGGTDLLARIERILATTHDFRELRLLASLQDAAGTVDPDLLPEAQRLLGGNGTALPARLGVEHDTTPEQLWRLAFEALRRWQGRAEDLRLLLPQRRAARVVVRSCEGMLAALTAR